MFIAQSTHKSCMEPVCDGDARLLILGSLPGERSLARQQYYAHPQNQFWKLIGHVIRADLDSLAYDERLQTLKNHRIALWDVVAHATRVGSLDSSLRQISGNDLTAFLVRLPRLRAIAFNGAVAAKTGRRMLGTDLSHPFITLPSSSPAFTLALSEKQRQWEQLRASLSNLEPSS